MFDYFCILTALILTRYSRQEYRVIAYILVAEFSAHKIAYILGIQITDLLDPTGIYAVYALIELFAIVVMLKYQAHLAIAALVFINLGYNMLTISQFVMPTYNFYGNYGLFVQSIMILELLYLAGITVYVSNYRRKYGFVNTSSIDKLFLVWGRSNNGLYVSRVKR